MTLVPFKEDPEGKKKVIEELLKGGSRSAEVQGDGSKDFCIEKLVDCYRLGGIECNNNYCAADLSTTLLPAQTQEQHAEHARKARPDEFRACGAPLVYAICKVLYEHKDNKKYARVVEEAKNFLQKTFQENWLNTLSRVQYNPRGLDKIIHE